MDKQREDFETWWVNQNNLTFDITLQTILEAE